MTRAIFIFIVAIAVAVAAALLAKVPGQVAVDWLGWRIEAPVGVAVAAIAAFSVLVTVAYLVMQFIIKTPARLRRARGHIRRRRANQALTQALAAIGAEDADEAARQTAQVETLMDQPALTDMLRAQGALLTGDDDAAEQRFASLVERPETEFLGVRGLMDLALVRRDLDQARERAERAFAMKPTLKWTGERLLALQVKAGLHDAAAKTLDRIASAKIHDAQRIKRMRAALELETGLAAARKGGSAEAMKRLRKAHDLAPDFAPASAELARLFLAEGKPKKAQNAIEETWKQAPHPDMLPPYFDAREAGDAMQRMRAAEHLASITPSHVESVAAAAGAAIEARLWGEARSQLDRLGEDDLIAKACVLRAQLEEAENNDSTKAREWLVRASKAPRGARWTCSACGAQAAKWDAVCGECHGFDTLGWVAPAAPKPALPPVEEAPALPAPESEGDGEAQA